MKNGLLSALASIPVAELDRDGWLKVGMALKEEGFDVSIWDQWSKDDDRYHDGECQRIWESFRGTDNPVTGATIIMMAQGYGWNSFDSDSEMDWDSEIEYDGYDDSSKQSKSSSVAPVSEWNPVEQLKLFLKTIFKPDEYVEYTTNDTFPDQSGKYRPAVGPYDRTAGELIAELDKHPDDIGAVIGDYKEEAGAWIQFNPVDGKGAKRENVTRYDYALLECDDIPKDEQIRLFREHKFPIVTMVDSGGKSVHALVAVTAKDEAEYSKRVRYLYQYCDDHNIPVDKQNKNPNRKTRMPGVTRNGNRQYIIDTNIGKSSWLEWVAYVEGSTVDAEDLPDMEPLSAYSSPPTLPEELIAGILRVGHKMLISGSSKAGKSLLLMELCIAIAEGLTWLGFQCKQGKILYVNLEIDKNSCINRFFDIYKAMGIPMNNVNNIVMWNLRGHAVPLNKLVPLLIEKIKDKGFTTVVIDPIYKVITGDENSATAMAEFTNNFDTICTETGCSAIYCHHHSKGAQGAKRAMDRASGSGVFARDPDAQLDVIELEVPEALKNQMSDPNATAWRMESSLREFANTTPVNYWFRYPTHVVDDTGILATLGPAGSAQAGRTKNEKSKTTDQASEEFRMAYDACDMDGKVTIKDMASYLGLSIQSVYTRIQKLSGEYILDHGMILRAG